MFERFTEEARRVLFFSRYEASVFGSPYIETQHLLLGFLREEKNSLPHPLKTHLDSAQFRKEIEDGLERNKSVSTSIDLPLSAESKRVFAYAAEEAHILESRHIGMEHLLLGFLREEHSLAGQLLRAQGLDLETQRSRLRPPSA